MKTEAQCREAFNQLEELHNRLHKFDKMKLLGVPPLLALSKLETMQKVLDQIHGFGPILNWVLDGEVPENKDHVDLMEWLKNGKEYVDDLDQLVAKYEVMAKTTETVEMADA